MSYISSLIKIAVKLTPTTPILWVANFKLKGIAKVMALDFDLDARTVYVQTQLYGEPETIEVSVEGFAMIHDEYGYQLIIAKANSNRPWLNNLLAHITAKPWKIPHIPQLAAYMGLAFELLKAD